ncbi:helix-turn-helix domain-containing protein [Pseudoduganella sp. GCM10020061]|uniref:helix-turn-helix domain-containing protein n=1 Tax=Pseudoduganella sp. GCM10020061 TaxID=3317345 RepID=UPI0036434C01
MSTDEQVTPVPPNEAPGQVLKARREAMGWSVEQIADQLKLAPRQVVALEAGDYDSLPPAAVVRGFVRGYAKVVKVDAAPLVAAIPVDAAAAAADASAGMRRERVAAPLPKVRYPSHGKRSRFPLMAAVVVALIAAAAAAAWYLDVFDTNPAPAQPAGSVAAPSLNGAAGTVTESVAAPAIPPNVGAPLNGATPADPALQQPSVPLISVPPPAANPSAPAGTAPAATPANPAANPGAGTTPAATQPAAPPAANPPVTTRGTMATLSTPAPAAAGGGALVLNVKQDSWIEVRGSGKPLISRLVKAGSTETFNISEPVTLVVGNPAGVDATLRGAALPLPQVQGRTVSRQTLK